MRPLLNSLGKTSRYQYRLTIRAHNSFHCTLQSRLKCFLNTRLSSSLSDKTYAIPIGNNGAVTLSVTEPASAPPPNQRPNVILYLPAGPLFSQNPSLTYPQSPSPQHVLASTTLSTVVTVNYRLGPVDPGTPPEERAPDVEYHRYPTPVHDTLAGVDWIQDTLRPAQLNVLGTHIGGSLALMLALTEAQSINAVAALEPVCDWTGLDEFCTISTDNNTSQKSKFSSRKNTKRNLSSSTPSDLAPLLEARERFFLTPERYFDAFASPLLFLRSAGKDVPKEYPRYLTGAEYPIPVLKSKAIDDVEEDSIYISDTDKDGTSSSNPNSDDTDSVNDTTKPAIRRRKALSRWPPYGLDYGLSGANNPYSPGVGRLQMALPSVRLFVRDEDIPATSAPDSRSKTVVNQTILAQQADEMADVMRRACFWGREKGYAENRVTLSRSLPDIWPVSGTRDAAIWLRDVVEVD